MAYIGNDLQVAYQSYQIIDDISGSFNGSTTSFALLVGGVAPVPFPINEQQCLISVGGVIQEPDPTGTNGFRFSGGNIVFSSAPGSGEDFFGVILAGADYVNVGVNYPSGSVSAPSITFDTDLDTGIYNPAANELGLVTNGSDAIRINSSGDVTIGSDLTVDTDTLYVDSANDRVGIGTTSPLRDLHVSNGGAEGFEFGPGETANINQILHYNRSTSAYIENSNRASAHSWDINTSEAARIDTSGRLLVGTSSTSVVSRAVLQGNSSDSTGATLLYLQRGQAAASISSGATLGTIDFADNAGNIYAEIAGQTDAAGGSGDYPGRLVFSTTADGASSPTERMRIKENGDTINAGVYNFTTANAANVYVFSSGELRRSTSSGKYKTNVETLEDSYSDALLNCRPVWYRSTCDKDNPNWGWWGFIAEEVAEIDPRLVHWKTAKVAYDENGSAVSTPCDPEPEGVAYDRFVPHLLNLIKRQKEQIEAMEARLSALEAS